MSGLFQHLDLGGTAFQKIRTLIERIDNFNNLMKNIEKISIIKLVDLFKISDHPLVSALQKSKIYREAIESVGKGRMACSMFPETTKQKGCPLHANNNVQCKVLVRFGMALADMNDILRPDCLPDGVSKAFVCGEKEHHDVAHVRLTNTNRFTKTKKKEGHYKKENDRRVLQCHGKHAAPLSLTKVSKCLSGRNTVSSQDPPIDTCPDLQTKWEMIEIFNAAIHTIVGNTRPCDYFDDVPSLKGCERELTVPPSTEDSMKSCTHQCAFMRAVAEAYGNLMDALLPPYRNKRGTCYAYQTTSTHLRTFHLIDDFCK